MDASNRKCPPDIGELAENYHLGRLSPEQIAALEEHYLSCPRCTEELERVEAYVKAMRAATTRAGGKETPASTVSRG
jgi:anti-sigma factor RsiW